MTFIVQQIMEELPETHFEQYLMVMLGDAFATDTLQFTRPLIKWMERMYKSAISVYDDFEVKVPTRTFLQVLENEFVDFYLNNKSKYRVLVEIDKQAFTDLSRYSNSTTQTGTNTINQGYQGFDTSNQQLNYKKDTNEISAQNVTTNKREGLELLMKQIYQDMNAMVKSIIFEYCVTIY